MARFWRRSRDWPLLGQLAFALLIIFVVAALSIAISDALRGSDATNRGSPTPARVTTVATSPSTTRSPTTTRFSPAPSGLIPLTIAPQSHEDSYSREADFGGWIEQNGCQDTRAVLLTRASSAPVAYTSANACTVASGRWVDPWSGAVTTDAHDFQIDHTVPLYNAWVSGAWSWSDPRRVAYANALNDKDHLVPVDASENQSKGADGPDEWRPSNRGTWCRYAIAWNRIKAKWHLTATTNEWQALVDMAATC